jgi:hypothetical protein
MDNITHYPSDMDGVILRGSTLIPGAQVERFTYHPTWIRESIADVKI